MKKRKKNQKVYSTILIKDFKNKILANLCKILQIKQQK